MNARSGAFINLAGTVGCTIYAVAYLAERLTTGEVSHATERIGVKIFRWAMVLGVAKLGIILAVVGKNFPWRTGIWVIPFVALTALLLIEDFWDGLLAGGITSLVFLAAAGGTRLCVYLARGGKPS